MSKSVNIGGDRLGSGAKLNTALHSYSRSTHDLSNLFQTTMSAGTLVPFMVKIGLPGDTFDIDLDAIVRTHPTLGPLFGSFKIQLDVFTVPFRLYNRSLHNNKLNVGMSMSQIKLPQLRVSGPNMSLIKYGTLGIPYEYQQINQSSLLAYLGTRGLGSASSGDGVKTTVNAVPLLAYWDIFKNYYANKQEEAAYVIHGEAPSITTFTINGNNLPYTPTKATDVIHVIGKNLSLQAIEVQMGAGGNWVSLERVMGTPIEDYYITWVAEGEEFYMERTGSYTNVSWAASRIALNANLTNIKPNLQYFWLENIDKMREALLSHNDATPYIIEQEADIYKHPYNLQTGLVSGSDWQMAATCGQEGLAVKTYQSDIFNNWVQTDWIEGAGSIAAITAISTAGGSFTLDTLNLSKKLYDMLNRIAVSGGSFEDWVSAVYDHSSKWRAEGPVYQGGLSKELVFQEVLSTADTKEVPLGTLAGKGVMTSKHKGGRIVINIDEPVIIMGIVSITPRVTYSQGNEWFSTALKSMDDLHKPALDGIGFQDLVTDQMAFWDTIYDPAGTPNMAPTFKSAGKQPAWLNYMTDHNRAFGNFADPRTQMFMTLNRRYERDSETGYIKDLTTYIDPAKFNYAFAQVDLSAQNFWMQIACNITARRKISAKIIPNL